MRKMLVSDFDDTLFINNEQFKENLKDIEKWREKNNIFVIATGNNYEQFLKIVKEKNIKYDYLILDQGSVITNCKNEVIFSCNMEKELVNKIDTELKNANDDVKPYFFGVRAPCQNTGAEPITKISVNLDNSEKLIKLNNKLKDNYKDYINSYIMIYDDLNLIEIISNKTDKENAIRKIAQIENMPSDSIYTIGNGYNDICMIQAFNGFCMKNSVPELLEKCDNQVNSVKELIEKII